MIALLSIALADPAALRAPGDTAVDLGAPTLSVAHWRASTGLAGWIRTDGGSAGLAVGTRRLPERFGFVGHASTGLVVPLVRPTLGLHASLAAGVGRTGERSDHRLQVVLPFTAAYGELRAPVLLEGSSTFRAGGWSIGGRGAVGAIFGRTRPSLAVQGALVVSRRQAR